MDHLTERDLRAGMRLLHNVSAAGAGGRAFAEACIAGLRGLVACEITTLSVCDLRSGRRSVVGSAGASLSEQDQACFDRHFSEHPLVRYHGYARGQGSHRISDSMPFAQFRDTPLFDEYYRRIGIDHVVALPIDREGDRLVSLVLNRRGRDFSDRDCAMLDLVRAPLAKLYLQAGTLERTRAALAGCHSLFEQRGIAWLQLGHGREVIAASARALPWLADYARADCRIGSALPGGLDQWVSRVEARTPADPARVAELVLTKAGNRLRLQAVPNTAIDGVELPGLLIVLEEQLAHADSARFDATPLTRREREVMHWLAAGKTDREIAALLGCSHRTVQKHLERTYQKLGVETRTAAVMRALESRPH